MVRFSLITIMSLLCVCPQLPAQDDEVPLGDVARALRKAKPAVEERPVIDNDNLPAMMERAESERLNGKPVFSIDSSGKTFRMTSPDGTCSISFDAKATGLIAVPYVASDLPQDQLAKLDGPATIREGLFEVSLHNGTGWELKEIVVGITTPPPQSRPQVVSAALEAAADLDVGTRFPDVTTLYHLKATAPPDSVTLFQGNLPSDWEQGKEWHWALVAARGVPPAAPALVPADQTSISRVPAGPVPPPSLATPRPSETAADPIAPPAPDAR
ncbi:MAG: hypothetical protein JO356_15410 [Acidobacteria bacterium]|nr:hypothetical protein [Acidobacteriota bacterium]